MMRRMVLDAIRTDPRLNNGEYKRSRMVLAAAWISCSLWAAADTEDEKDEPTATKRHFSGKLSYTLHENTGRQDMPTI